MKELYLSKNSLGSNTVVRLVEYLIKKTNIETLGL
jgi:Ran GTPase-activating protein (RanGAP) involved in mRNA processing and transport